MFGKSQLARNNQPEKVGAIDDITAVLVILNPKVNKQDLINTMNENRD